MTSDRSRPWLAQWHTRYSAGGGEYRQRPVEIGEQSGSFRDHLRRPRTTRPRIGVYQPNLAALLDPGHFVSSRRTMVRLADAPRSARGTDVSRCRFTGSVSASVVVLAVVGRVGNRHDCIGQQPAAAAKCLVARIAAGKAGVAGTSADGANGSRWWQRVQQPVSLDIELFTGRLVRIRWWRGGQLTPWESAGSYEVKISASFDEVQLDTE